MIVVVVRVAGRCGSSINKGKRSVMLYNYTGIPMERVKGVAVTNSIRYLRLDMGNSWKCFSAYKKGRVALAEKMANMTFSVVHRSFNKVLIGKTYWKSVVQPRVLNASSVVVWSGEEKEKEKFARVENRVWRQIPGAPVYTPAVAQLREGIGRLSWDLGDIC